MSDLADFLLARIAEDEADARNNEPPWLNRYGERLDRLSPTRVLTECEAKRRIIAEHQRFGSYDERLHDDLVLCLLALPYADHPDYREAWRP